MKWWGKYSLEDIKKAHEFSSNHREQLLQDKRCGCFCCGRIFTPQDIVDWIDWGPDSEGTAMCPCCLVDAVIGESSGYPITEEFLEEMHMYWF